MAMSHLPKPSCIIIMPCVFPIARLPCPGRHPARIAVIEAYLRAQRLLREDGSDGTPAYSRVVQLDLASVCRDAGTVVWWRCDRHDWQGLPIHNLSQWLVLRCLAVTLARVGDIFCFQRDNRCVTRIQVNGDMCRWCRPSAGQSGRRTVSLWRNPRRTSGRA
jgi:hypothetical protein